MPSKFGVLHKSFTGRQPKHDLKMNSVAHGRHFTGWYEAYMNALYDNFTMPSQGESTETEL